jgi:mRNA interferase MazF
MKPKSGEIWLADLGLAAKARPVAIISADDPNPPRALFIYIPLTNQNRGSKYEVPLGHLTWLTKDSVANVQGIGSLPAARFERKIGQLPKEDFLKIKQALIDACDLKTAFER